MITSVSKSQYDDLQKRHENMRKNREREQRRCSKLEDEIETLRQHLSAERAISDNLEKALETIGEFHAGLRSNEVAQEFRRIANNALAELATMRKGETE